MENLDVADGEMRQIVELSMDGKQDEANAMRDDVDERIRKVAREEARAAVAATDRERDRVLSAMAMTAGLLAGMALAVVTMWCADKYANMNFSIPAAAGLAFIFAAIGALLGRYVAK